MIAACAMIAVIAFSLVNALRHVAERAQSDRREAVREAEILVHELGATLADAQEMMRAAHLAEAIGSGRSAECHSFLAGLLAGRDVFNDIATVDAQGNVLCSGTTLSAPLNVGDQDWFRRFQSIKTFSVAGAKSDVALLTAAFPFINDPDTYSGPVSLSVVSIRIDRLRTAARIAPLPSGPTLFLMSVDGEVLVVDGTDTALPEESSIASILLSQTGFAAAAARSGQPYSYAAASLDDRGIVAVLARASAPVDTAFLRELVIEAAIPILITAGSLLLIWLLLHRASRRWIHALQAVAEPEGRGKYSLGNGDFDLPPMEYRDLRIALDRLVEEMEQRRNQLLDASSGHHYLLREVHHRVKNNLQILISMLNLLERGAADEPTRLTIRGVQARVECLALVHQMAYMSGDMRRVSMQSLVPELVAHIVNLFEADDALVHIDTEVDDIVLSMDQTMPLAQLMTEALANSLRHAFVGRSAGHIDVRLKRAGEGRLILEVADDGIGLPAGFESKTDRRGIGRSLMSGLAEQLFGTVTYRSDKGTTVTAHLEVAGAPDDGNQREHPGNR